MDGIYKSYRQPGYPGRDVMRENAIREFGREMKMVDKEIGSFSAPSRTKMRLFKKGGHVGVQGGSLTNMHFPKPMGFGKSPTSSLHVEKGKTMKRGRMEQHRHKKGYDHGGHTVKVYKTGGHTVHGGNIYEREMMGESHHHRANNYESMMRGEHCRSHAGGHSSMNDGSHITPRGKHARFAAGGVAKVRHNQATPSGHPMGSRGSKMKVY